MSIQITSSAFHLKYSPEEDRLLFSVDFSAEQELGVLLTRRMTRGIIENLVKLVAGKPGDNPTLKNALLEFEHNRAVTTALKDGNVRRQDKGKPLVTPPKLAHDVKISFRPGQLSLVLDNGEHALSLDIASGRAHTVIAIFLHMADKAGWEFPPLAAWLEKPISPIAEPTAQKVIN